MIEVNNEFTNYNNLIDALKNDDVIYDLPNAMDNWMNYGVVKKDILNGQELKVLELRGCDGVTFGLLCENAMVIPCYVKKERPFFEMLGLDFDTPNLVAWLKTPEACEWFKSKKIVLSTIVDGKLVYGSLVQALADNRREDFFKEIKNPTNAYLGKVTGKNVGGFIVDVEGVIAFLPGSLASANKIVDFDSFIGKKVHVMVEDYIREGDTFIVSNKKYIQYIMPKKLEEIDFHKKYKGEITGTSSFGIFIEFDEIFTGLLHVSEMTEETKELFNGEGSRRFLPGEEIEFYIKEIGKNNRIILSEKELVEKTVTLDDFKKDCEKTFQNGFIVNIRQVGSFIKFKYKDENFIGLLHYKEYPNNFIPELGKELKLWIVRVDVESNRIFLKWDLE